MDAEALVVLPRRWQFLETTPVLIPAFVHGADTGRGIKSNKGLDVIRECVLVVEHRLAQRAVLPNRDVLAEQQPQDFERQALLGTLSDNLEDFVETNAMDLAEVAETKGRCCPRWF